MSGHSEAERAGLKAFFFIFHFVVGAPPPLLMHIGTVGRIDEAQRRLINIGVHHQLFVNKDLADGFFDLGWIHGRGCIFGAGQINPGEFSLFPNRIVPDRNFGHIHVVLEMQGRDGGASAVTAKSPAMIRAFNRVVDNPSLGKRRGAVRANIAKGKDRAVFFAAQRDRLSGNFDTDQLARFHIA